VLFHKPLFKEGIATHYFSSDLKIHFPHKRDVSTASGPCMIIRVIYSWPYHMHSESTKRDILDQFWAAIQVLKSPKNVGCAAPGLAKMAASVVAGNATLKAQWLTNPKMALTSGALRRKYATNSWSAVFT